MNYVNHLTYVLEMLRVIVFSNLPDILSLKPKRILAVIMSRYLVQFK